MEMDTADVADAADAADPWVVRRVDAKLFWRFLLIFFISIELMSKIVSCSMQIYILCTGMALKGAILECGRKKGRSCWWSGVGALAYDKDLNGNMH